MARFIPSSHEFRHSNGHVLFCYYFPLLCQCMAATTAHLQIEGFFPFSLFKRALSVPVLDYGIFWLSVSDFVFICCAAVLNDLCCIFLQKQQGDLVTQFMLALGMQFKHFGSYLFCCNLKMHTIFVVNATHKTVVNRRSWPHGLKHLHCYFISLMFILVPIISRGSYFDMFVQLPVSLPLFFDIVAQRRWDEDIFTN